MSLAISEVTVDKLQVGQYRDAFPEFYKLTTVVENNAGHDHQSVFDHVLSVYDHLLQLIEVLTTDQITGVHLETYLSQKIDRHSRLDLLKVMVLLHDIAKPDVVVASPGGIVACPGHELLGAARVSTLGNHFGLTTSEKTYVKHLIAHHGLTNNLVYLAMASNKPESAWQLLTEALGEAAVEAIIFEAADLEGGDLKQLDAEHYAKRQQVTNALLSLAIQQVVAQQS